MYRIEVELEGVATILFNGWSKAAIDGLRTGKTGRKFTDAQRAEEAMEKLHRADDGELCLPVIAFEKCLQEGASLGNFKEGKKSLVPYLKATVFEEGLLRLGVREPHGIHEVVGRRPPIKGAACLVKRPFLSSGWRATGVLTVTDDRRDPGLLRQLAEEAGLLVGVGSWRPRFGRFVVRKWQVQDRAAPARAAKKK